MILITSAKYVNPELQAEFGKIPPSFLPLGGKRLYEHQIALFDKQDEKIVLSLPKSYQIHQWDFQKLDRNNVEIIYISDDLTLGESIVYALNMLLPLDEHLRILHGDTLFKKIDFCLTSENSLMASYVDVNYDWTYLFKDNKNLFNINDFQDIDTSSDLILSGYFSFSHPYELIRSIVKSSYSFIDGLMEYGRITGFEVTLSDSWMDFGLVASYFHSRKSMTTERVFNELKIENGYVTKCSKKGKKLLAEINWFQNFPKDMNLYIPRFVLDKNNCYKTEYMHLSTLSELYVFGDFPVFEWKKIFFAIKTFVQKLHSHKADELIINYDYKKKTTERLFIFSKENNIDLKKKWVYNSEVMPSLLEILDRLDGYMDDKSELVLIHGDLCFSNIMYDFRANQIKVFDPRGMDFDSKVTPYGEADYDYAKLIHSIFGLYDHIIAGSYICKIRDYDIHFEIEVSNNIKKIQKCYSEVFGSASFKKLYVVMIHLFLSMLPLHNDDRNKQDALLSNAFRLYNNLTRVSL